MTSLIIETNFYGDKINRRMIFDGEYFDRILSET